jgi:hypothetical protein
VNRRSFLAALPFVPAALAASTAKEEATRIITADLYGPDAWHEAREFAEAETAHLADLYGKLVSSTRKLIAESPVYEALQRRELL